MSRREGDTPGAQSARGDARIGSAILATVLTLGAFAAPLEAWAQAQTGSQPGELILRQHERMEERRKKREEREQVQEPAAEVDATGASAGEHASGETELAPEPEPEGLWDQYNALLERRVEQVTQRDDLWRNTLVPLKGMFLLNYKYKTVKTSKRFDDQGNAGPTLKPIDVFGGKLDFGLTGKGEAHTFQLYYGITDRVTFFAEQPFGHLTPTFHVRYDPPPNDSATSTASLLDALLPQLYPDDFTESLQTLEGLWQAIELFGRPRPNIDQVVDDLVLGDLTFGVGADYLRTEHLGLASAFKVVAPVGHLAEANNSLIFALGPEIDIGVGSWGLQAQQWIDWRFPKPLDFLSWTFDFGYQYYFESTRDSPTNFTPPVPFRVSSKQQPVIAALFRSVLPPEHTEPLPGGGYAVNGTLIDVIDAVDPATAAQLAPVFPDLSGLAPSYQYKPGSQFACELMASYSLFGIGIAGGSNFNWTESAEIRGNVPEFAQFVDAVQLVAEGWRWSAWTKLSVPLFPLRIPAVAAAGIEFALEGKNSFIFDDNIEVTFGFISPWFFPD